MDADSVPDFYQTLLSEPEPEPEEEPEAPVPPGYTPEQLTLLQERSNLYETMIAIPGVQEAILEATGRGSGQKAQKPATEMTEADHLRARIDQLEPMIGKLASALDFVLKSQADPELAGVRDKFMEYRARNPNLSDSDIKRLVRPEKPTRNGNGTPVPKRPESRSAGSRHAVTPSDDAEDLKRIHAAGGNTDLAVALALRRALKLERQSE